MNDLLKKLQGGDMRSIGRADEVVAEVGENENLFTDLVEGLFQEDGLIRMRAADAIEKIVRKNRPLLYPYQYQILEHFSTPKLQDEVKMSLPLLLGYMKLEEERLSLVLENLHRWLGNAKNKFVKVMCMQGLADQALQHEWLLQEVIATIEAQMVEGSASIKARGRILLKKLGE